MSMTRGMFIVRSGVENLGKTGVYESRRKDQVKIEQGWR
jgi:hypothetical protein